MSETIDQATRPPKTGPDNEASPPKAPDPIRDLIQRLDQEAGRISSQDPALSRVLGQISQTAAQPGRTDEAQFRTRVAYALQDVEKLSGPISTVPDALRQEMTKLAATAPGLQNDRLQDLVRSTPKLDDAALVREIRTTATNVGRFLGDQNAQSVTDRVEALENRVRLATGAADPAPSAQSGAAVGNGAQGSIPNSAQRSPAADRNASSSEPGWSDNSSSLPQGRQTLNQSGAQTQSQQTSQPAQPVSASGPGVMSLAWTMLNRQREARAAEAPAQPTSIAERSERHENVQQQMRDQTVIQGAERSQRAALDALQSFAKGPASNILSKIQEAAKTEPGGMQAVLSEMREGGRFADLRSQFNVDMVKERGMSVAYEKLAGNLQQYGADRATVDAIGARSNKGAELSAKFEKLDAEVGKSASIIPSKTDGKGILDDLGDKLREVLNRAVQAVRSAITPNADPSRRASSGPSPSP